MGKNKYTQEKLRKSRKKILQSIDDLPQAVAWLRCCQAMQENVPKRWALSYHCLTKPFNVILFYVVNYFPYIFPHDIYLLKLR